MFNYRNMVIGFIIFLFLFSVIIYSKSLEGVGGVLLKKLMGWIFCFFGLINYTIFFFKHFVLENEFMAEFFSNQVNFKQNLFTLFFKISLPLLIAPILLFSSSNNIRMPISERDSDYINTINQLLLFFTRVKAVVGYSLLTNGILFFIVSLSADWESLTIYLLISYCIFFGTLLISGALFLLNYNSEFQLLEE